MIHPRFEDFIFERYTIDTNCINTFDSAVVVAETEEDAKHIHPCVPSDPRYNYPSWTTSDNVTCKLLSETVSSDLQAGDIVCASFWNS